MTNKSNSLTKYLPIFLSIALIVGILIGIFLTGKNNFTSKFKSYDKINDVINFAMQDYVDTISKERLEEKAITGMLESLDPHSVYIPAEDFHNANDPLMGNFEGIGVQFRIQNDTIMVINTIVGGPSEKVGLKAGDRIVNVDGKKVAGIGIKDTEVIKKLKGKKGSKVKVEIFRRGVSHLLNFDIIRDVIPTYSIDIDYMVDKNIGYIKLSKFSATTSQEFSDALMRLKGKGMKGLILDLRGNGGGYLQSAIDVADHFLGTHKIIVYTEGKNRRKQIASATSEGLFEKEELVVLIDEFSASASEIIAGAIQDNDRGLIIGRRSFGKGLVQEQFSLSDGSAVRLTVARYHTPTGRCIQKSYQNGYENYMNDLNDRFLNGEFEKPDTSKFADSLKYRTPKGKIVYGGGGIMPDIYIPMVADRKLEYYNQLINKGLIYQFAFDYTDKNRKNLSIYKNADDYTLRFLVNNNIINDFINYATVNGVNKQSIGFNESIEKIKILLKAYIARNLFDDIGFYPIYLKTDNAFLKAVEEINKRK